MTYNFCSVMTFLSFITPKLIELKNKGSVQTQNCGAQKPPLKAEFSLKAKLQPANWLSLESLVIASYILIS